MENNSIDIKELWNKQEVPAANQSGLFSRIRRFRRKGIGKLLILNILLLLTILFATFIWIYFQPQLISTKIGILLTVLAMGIVMAYSSRLLPFYRKIDENCSNLDYLNELYAVKNKMDFIQTKILNLYFALLSLGIGLYMYEYIADMPLKSGIMAYSAFFLWVGINWFVLRPRIIRKNRQKMNRLIEQVEKIKRQLSNG